IHTREAFEVYLDRLTENGAFALVVQEEPVLVRSFLTAVSVLRARGEGVRQACRHLVAAVIPEELRYFTPHRRILLFRKKAFTPEEGERVLQVIKNAGIHPVFVPYALENIPPFAPLASGAQGLEEFIAGYRFTPGYGIPSVPMNVAPRCDDQPFFLDLSLTLPEALRRLLWGTTVAVALAAGWLGVRRRRRGAPGGAAGGVAGAGYFTLLGAGFMLLEVPLIQQFVLFLEHPVRSMALVLFALLLGTAAGSRWSQRRPLFALPGAVAAAAFSAALLALLYRGGLPKVFGALLLQHLVVRELVTFLLCLPLGFALGIPFPSGIRWTQRDDPGQVPWLWGINGLASVLGSALAMTLAWLWGFSAALLAGACCYLLTGALALAIDRAGAREARQS
ncbi:MAG: hypothetical protein QHJ73_19410, partial [Armatimonadota bacterium]|nr:hypothetical protein [Armatimonadota bacterium]